MFKGIGVSAGIGIGRAYFVGQPDLDYSHVSFAGVEAEQARLNDALARFKVQTRELAEDTVSRAGQAQGEILLGQIAMLEDPCLLEEIYALITDGVCAEAAVDQVCRNYVEMFSAMEDELMCQRGADVEDMKNRMLRILLSRKEADLSRLPADAILVARDLTPSMTVGLGHIAGIVTELGGTTSHTAILARALEIPAVVGVSDAMQLVKRDMTLVIDGGAGLVIPNPDEQTLERYSRKRVNYLQARSALSQFAGLPTRTMDGHTVALFGNIGTAGQAGQVAQETGEGVGLFRTEFLFLERESLPDEEEQFESYRRAAQNLGDRPLIIRTLDMGGDKDIPCLGLEKEDNPFLGVRGIRWCLRREDIFLPQLRAILRASAYGRIKLMLPMVTTVEEVRAVRDLIARLEAELDIARIPYGKDVEVGVMIETPAAAMIADLLAKESDFFSIGTNDLTQYVMAADRGNRKVTSLGDPLQPAVLRCIRSVIKAGHEAGIPVGMCGEAAADPEMIPLLLAFGLDEFSVTPNAILRTRRAIAGWSMEQARELTEKVMSCATVQEVRACLKHENCLK